MQNKFRAVGAAQNSIPIIYAAKARSGIKGRRTRSVEECTDSRLGPQMFYIFARTCNSLAAGARDHDDDCAACPRIPAQHLERWSSKRVESHWRLEARQKNRSWRREQGGGEVDDLFFFLFSPSATLRAPGNERSRPRPPPGAASSPAVRSQRRSPND